MAHVQHASSSSRGRMLRQGRGAGFREALASGPGAVSDVIACVLDDPRFDRLIEDRDEYYARLLVALDADVEPIIAHVLREDDTSDESNFGLPIGVLAELCRRANPAACRAIARAVESGRGWRDCLDALETAGGESLVGQVLNQTVIEALLARIDATELADAARNVAAPWDKWAAEVPALRFLAEARTHRTVRPKPGSGPIVWIANRPREPVAPWISPTMTTAELLALTTSAAVAYHVEPILDARDDDDTNRILLQTATSGSPDQRRLVLHILGRRGVTQFVDSAEGFLREESRLPRDPLDRRKRHDTRLAYSQYLERLPPKVTLSRARQWFAGRWPLSLVGEHILARHATRDDRAMLEDAGAAALAANNMYRLCSIVDGLGAVGAVESVPFLAEVYCEIPYSYGRRFVAKALSSHAACGTTEELLVEALWDCESESREIACTTVPSTTPSTSHRLREIARDEFEEASVREAARHAQCRALL